MESGIDEKDLVKFVHWWAYDRRNSFFLWEYKELVSETWLQSSYLLEAFDPVKSQYSTYLNAFLYSRVHWAYVKANQIQVVKKKGSPRKYIRKNRSIENLDRDEYDRLIAVEDPEPIDQPHFMISLPDGFNDIGEYLRRGLNQRQIAFSLGVTESRISQRMKEMRKKLGLS
tara:strand:+ start:433 stop:945 length:513 start_codon:yes stop_codon:yes gene_type:complete